MKSFDFFVDNIGQMPIELAMALFSKKPRRIGVSYHKELLTDRFGIRKEITFWFWKWYKSIVWISKEK